MARPRLLLKIGLALGVVGVLAVALVAYWWLVCERLQAVTLAGIDQVRGRGYALEYRALRRAGFPSHARVVIAQPDLRAAGWQWAGARATVEVALFAPWAPHLTISGDQRLTVVDGGTARAYAGHLGVLDYAYQPGGWLPTGRLSVRDLRLAAVANGDALAIGALDASASGDPQAAADAAAVGYRLSVRASAVEPPAPLRLPLAPAIDRLAVDAELKGALAAAPWPDSVGAWRAAGGSVELTALALGYGPLAVEGSGTLALDRANQPLAALSFAVRGLPAALDALAARGLVDARAAQALTPLLGTGTGAGTGHGTGTGDGTLTVPITIQDRMLSVGPLPIGRLPVLVWARPARSHP